MKQKLSTMHSNYLFPNRYKKIGWIILIPAIVLGLVMIVESFELAFLDFNVPAIFVNQLFGEKQLYGIIQNNLLDEIIGILIIVGGLLVAFSKEKQEDEFINKIRLESLVWATYINYAILILAFLIVYDYSFFLVMLFNIFTILIFFIIRFKWQLVKLQNSNNHEE